MSNIVKADAGSLELGEWQALRESAKAVVTSGFLPKAINTPEKAITLMLAGRELGLGPMQAIRSLHIIDGKPVMSADLMAGLVHKKLPGALLRVVESTNERCEVDAARQGQEPTRYVFSIDDAKAAQLLNKDNWKKYPRAMLRARCLSEAVRATFPDVMLGVYDPDELGAVTTADGEIIEVNPGNGHAEDDAADLLEALGGCETADVLAELKQDARDRWRSMLDGTRYEVRKAVEAAEERLGEVVA